MCVNMGEPEFELKSPFCTKGEKTHIIRQWSALLCGGLPKPYCVIQVEDIKQQADVRPVLGITRTFPERADITLCKSDRRIFICGCLNVVPAKRRPVGDLCSCRTTSLLDNEESHLTG